MWIELGRDYVNLDTAYLVEVEGSMLIVHVPERQFRGMDQAQTDAVEADIQKREDWVALEMDSPAGVRRAMYAQLAATTSIEHLDGEFRLYSGSTEFAAISADHAARLVPALTKRN